MPEGIKVEDESLKLNDKGEVVSEKVTEKDFDYTLNMGMLYKRRDIDLYNRLYRFGRYDPYNNLGNTKEYLFFVKPDLHIMGDKKGNDLNKLNPQLENHPFFRELLLKYPNVIGQLQYSADTTTKNPFSFLLSNMVISNLEVPSLDATTIDTPVNVYGTAYEYRGSSEASDDNFDFSLEFKDTAHLDVYHFFRAYEEYETLKMHGTVGPAHKYTINRTLHDQIGIYKIMVDSDYQTIVYYAYFCGVFFKSLPRDTFSNQEFSDGVRFSINMKAAFVEDMNPMILYDFNKLTESYRNSHTSGDVPIYDFDAGGVSGQPVAMPYITRIKSDIAGRERYKLNWKGVKE